DTPAAVTNPDERSSPDKARLLRRQVAQLRERWVEIKDTLETIQHRVAKEDNAPPAAYDESGAESSTGERESQPIAWLHLSVGRSACGNSRIDSTGTSLSSIRCPCCPTIQAIRINSIQG